MTGSRHPIHPSARHRRRRLLHDDEARPFQVLHQPLGGGSSPSRRQHGSPAARTEQEHDDAIADAVRLPGTSCPETADPPHRRAEYARPPRWSEGSGPRRSRPAPGLRLIRRGSRAMTICGLEVSTAEKMGHRGPGRKGWNERTRLPASPGEPRHRRRCQTLADERFSDTDRTRVTKAPTQWLGSWRKSLV